MTFEELKKIHFRLVCHLAMEEEHATNLDLEEIKDEPK